MIKKNFEKKDQLLEAALSEFSQKSFDDASLNNILAKADMSKGSFYYHFKNKKELYIFLIMEVAEAKFKFMDKELMKYNYDLENMNIFDLLRLYGRIGIKFSKSHPLYFQFTNKYIKEKNLGVKNEVRKRIEPVSNNFMEGLIIRAIKNGELRDDFSQEFIAKLFVFLFNNYDELVFNDFDKADINDILKKYDDFLEFIENGLGKKTRG